jgi:hypothetical protein
MCEIDDLHQPENQAQANRDQSIDEVHQQPADDRLNDDFLGHERIPAFVNFLVATPAKVKRRAAM